MSLFVMLEYFFLGVILAKITLKMALCTGDKIDFKQRLLVVLLWFFYLFILIRAYLNLNRKD